VSADLSAERHNPPSVWYFRHTYFVSPTVLTFSGCRKRLHINDLWKRPLLARGVLRIKQEGSSELLQEVRQFFAHWRTLSCSINSSWFPPSLVSQACSWGQIQRSPKEAVVADAAGWGALTVGALAT